MYLSRSVYTFLLQYNTYCFFLLYLTNLPEVRVSSGDNNKFYQMSFVFVDAIFSYSRNWTHIAEISPLNSCWEERASSTFNT